MNLLEVSPREYHTKMRCNRADIFAADSFLSKTVLWELDRDSLWKWRYHKEERKITEAMRWGSLIDCLTTSPELADTDIAISPYDSFRTAEARAWKTAQESAKKIVADREMMTEAKRAVDMLFRQCKASAAIFAKAKTQVIVAGQVHGVKVKGLVDIAPDGVDFLADLKTCSDFSLSGFARQTANLGYHVQAGIYLAFWNAMFPNDQRHRFKLIWQDSAPPYEACVTELSQSDLEAGWLYASVLVGRLVTATKNNHWPMAFEEEQIISRPTWAAIQQEDKL